MQSEIKRVSRRNPKYSMEQNVAEVKVFRISHWSLHYLPEIIRLGSAAKIGWRVDQSTTTYISTLRPETSQLREYYESRKLQLGKIPKLKPISGPGNVSDSWNEWISCRSHTYP